MYHREQTLGWKYKYPWWITLIEQESDDKQNIGYYYN